MRRVNFHRLYIFHTVAKQGSFTKAAAELSISQPAVSIQVKELERSMDTTLLSRMRSGVALTDTGEIVFNFTRRIFSLAEEMEYAIQDVAGLQAGRLTIGSSSTPGECILPLVIGRFHERYPRVDVSLAIHNTRSIIEKILDRELDLGMAGSEVEMKGLVSTHYANDEVVLVASASHALARKPRIAFEDISDEMYVVREPGSATRRAAEEYFEERGIRIRVSMELGSNEAVKRAAAAGLGIGALSKFSVAPDVAAGYLKILPVVGWKCERPLTIFYRDDTHMSAVQRAFLDILQSEQSLPEALMPSMPPKIPRRFPTPVRAGE